MVSEEFLGRMREMLGERFGEFEAAMGEAPTVSFKLNRRKLADVGLLGYGEPARVAWCESGYYLDERPNFTMNPLLHAGCFYVQDASSMVYETIVRGLVEREGVPSKVCVLDMCAAPGGKTTSMINAVGDGSLVVANEYVAQRATVLRENLLKWGYPDIIATNGGVEAYGEMGGSFHIVAVDAPCSGEGMMRKDEKAVEQWGSGLVRQCSGLQREILESAAEAVCEGGYLIYSTCTFNREENEENVRWLVEEKGFEGVDTGLAGCGGILPAFGELPGLRFMPHSTRGEGLFVAVLRKPGEMGMVRPSETAERVRKNRKLRKILDGIPKMEMKGKLEIPTSEGVLSTDYREGCFPEVELGHEDAMKYLRHEAIVLGEGKERGFVVVKYKGYRLGLVKNIGSRANNLYPRGWRVRAMG